MIPKQKALRLKGKAKIDRYKEVYERDNNECQYGMCKAALNHTPSLDIPHHVLLKSQGGGDELGNLICLCVFCHRHIHDNPDIKITNENGEWVFTRMESKIVKKIVKEPAYTIPRKLCD